MAAGTVQLADVIVPAVFTPYVQQLTEEKSRLVQSGLMNRSSYLTTFLNGPGLTINVPNFKDLENDPENISTDQPANSTPNKIGTAIEIAVRLSRNNSWASYDLVEALLDKDPMQVIANRVAAYWMRRAQALFIATMTGVFADNAAAPTGTEHVINDLTMDIKGGAFVDGTTNFSAEAFIDASLTMGDSMNDLGIALMHSVVYGRMMKNNMIDMVPDAVQNINIPTFLGREVIVDDSMPAAAGVYETWLFGRGSVLWGAGAPAVPTETDRMPATGNGGGAEVLFNRVEWAIHPVGHKYVGTSPAGGPSNANTANNLANATSFQRAYTERKQIKIARLITREA